MHLLPGYDQLTEATAIEYFDTYNQRCKEMLIKSRDKADRERVQKLLDIVGSSKSNAKPEMKKILFINRAIRELANKLIV